MSALYNAIKDVEDASASYGKGLFLVSKEKARYTAWGEAGSGNYWTTSKEAATKASSFGCPGDYAWFGTVHGSYNAWYVHSSGNIYGGNSQHNDFVVAPTFNLDLSKVEVVGDEIVIKNSVKKEKIRKCLNEIFKESEILPENFGEEIVAELEERFLEDGYMVTKKTVIEEMLWCYMCKMQ